MGACGAERPLCLHKKRKEKPMKAAIIGTGMIGTRYARLIASGAVPGMELTAAVCRRPEVQEKLRQLCPGIHVWDSEEALYGESDSFDAVLITTPHKLHPQMAVRALKAGKHVLTDKPIGISVAQTRELQEAVQATDRTFAIMFHQRMYPKYRKIKELLEEGRLGRIYRSSMENSRFFRTEHYHHSSPWRSSWQGEGGGMLINQGQHPLDIWQWLFGMPDMVSAQVAFGKYNAFRVDDEAMLFFRYPDQRTGTFFLTTGEGCAQDRLEICGSRGTALLEGDRLTMEWYDQDLDEYRHRAGADSREELGVHREVLELPTGEEPYARMLQDFVSAAETGCAPAAPGLEGLHALELMNAAYLSAWSGETIALPMDAARYEEELERHIREEKACSRT